MRMLRPMKIALATCSNLPGWEVDDQPFHEALSDRNIEVSMPIWDDPDVDWTKYDACLIRTTWDYMEKQNSYVRWAKEVGRQIPFFNHPEVIKWNTHKSYLRILEAEGVPIAPTVWLPKGSEFDVAKGMADRGWNRGFLKPMVGATARETLRFSSDAAGFTEAQKHLDRTLAVEDMMVQPYLHRVEEKGELSGIFFDGVLSHCVQKIPVEGYYRVQDDFGAKDFPVKMAPEDFALAQRVVDAAHGVLSCLNGAPLLYARVDFLWDNEDNLCVTELELVEPSLFFRHEPKAAGRLADALVQRVRQS
jgi:hypothetical protein